MVDLQFIPGRGYPPFSGPYDGGPGGFQNIVYPCTCATSGSIISMGIPNNLQWPRQLLEQQVFGGVADASPSGDIYADVAGFGPLPVYNQSVIATGSILEGDYFQLCYDSSLGSAGGFHLLNWSAPFVAPALSLTTNGSTGPSTFIDDVLNVPDYSLGLVGTTVVITVDVTIVVAPGDQVIIINKAAPSPTAITLPAVATRNGLGLRIADWGGNAGDVTITPDGAETIMGLPTAVIGSGGQGVGTAAIITLYPSTDMNGWYQS